MQKTSIFTALLCNMVFVLGCGSTDGDHSEEIITRRDEPPAILDESPVIPAIGEELCPGSFEPVPLIEEPVRPEPGDGPPGFDPMAASLRSRLAEMQDTDSVRVSFSLVYRPWWVPFDKSPRGWHSLGWAFEEGKPDRIIDCSFGTDDERVLSCIQAVGVTGSGVDACLEKIRIYGALETEYDRKLDVVWDAAWKLMYRWLAEATGIELDDSYRQGYVVDRIELTKAEIISLARYKSLIEHIGLWTPAVPAN